MTAVPKPRKLTEAEYLAIEEKAERKSEFHDGQMFLMAGASREHNAITRNLTSELHQALKGGPCQVFVADQRVEVEATGLHAYPDLVGVGSVMAFTTENPNTLVNPTVVMEVTTPATWKRDRVFKLRHYKQIPTLREYLLVYQDEPLVERFVRAANGRWEQEEFVGLDATLALATVPAEVPLAEVYRGVEFPEPPPRPAET